MQGTSLVHVVAASPAERRQRSDAFAEGGRDELARKLESYEVGAAD